MKIDINPIPGTILNEVFITDFSQAIGYYITFHEGGKVLSHQIDRNKVGDIDQVKPAFIIDELITRELITAFSDLARRRGVENDSESKAKGKLEATEYHLEDLRTLLKLDKITTHEKRIN